MAALNGSPEDVRRAALSPRPKGRGKSCCRFASNDFAVGRLKRLADDQVEQKAQRIRFAGM